MKTTRLFLIGCLLASSARAEPPPAVFVDAGHYHAAPGATSARGVPELAFNQALAKVVTRALAADGTRQVISSGGDGIADLRQRTALAQAMGAGLLISLHHDSVQPHLLQEWTWEGQTRLHSEHATGFSLFVSRRNPFPDRSSECASAIGRALRQAGFAINEKHDDPATGQRREWADRDNGVFYYDNLLVLRTAAMPAVLVEAGVIVNRDEEVRLAEPQTREAIAAAIRSGVRECGY